MLPRTFGNINNQAIAADSAGIPGTILAQTAMAYQYGSYVSVNVAPFVNLIRLPTSAKTEDGSGNVITRTDHAYESVPLHDERLEPDDDVYRQRATRQPNDDDVIRHACQRCRAHFRNGVLLRQRRDAEGHRREWTLVHDHVAVRLVLEQPDDYHHGDEPSRPDGKHGPRLLYGCRPQRQGREWAIGLHAGGWLRPRR